MQENFSTIANLKCDEHITQIGYAGNGSTIVCKDSNGIYFWDSKTGILKKKVTNEMFECENYNIELYFDNTNVYKTFGAYKHAVGIYLRNENNYIEGYKKEKEDREVLSSTDVLVKTSNSIYKINGLTGEIMWEIGSDNTETKIIPEHNSLIISGWNEEFGVNHAYIIDLETFDVSYDVDGYADYYENEDRLVVENYNVVGSYPLYTVRELVEKAQNYVSQ